jgi:6-phosphogluconolactonase
VPRDHADSNFRMVREAMLAVAPIPLMNIHPIPTAHFTPDQAVTQYEKELQRAYGAAQLDRNRPLFDICFFGLGDDGHTASLLPGEPVLAERKHWVAEVAHGRPETRITLTYPAINASQHIVFLVSGAAKRDILRALHAGSSTVPAAQLKPFGDLLFIVDRAAADG